MHRHIYLNHSIFNPKEASKITKKTFRNRGEVLTKKQIKLKKNLEIKEGVLPWGMHKYIIEKSRNSVPIKKTLKGKKRKNTITRLPRS